MPSPIATRFAFARKAAAIALATLLWVSPSLAQPFVTDVEHVLLIDQGTGTVLFQRNADTAMPPASLAKLMTLAVTFDAVAAGEIGLDTGFRISDNAWRKGGAASGASTMFAVQGSTVRVADLLRGIIIQSGNDAAIAVAEGIAGSEAAFAERMNAEAARIGLTGSHFVNPSGLPEDGQFVTARDMARLAAYILGNHRQFLPIFAEREFTWSAITQRNRNPLLGLDIGVDGMATGFTDEAGYGLVATALRDGRRLIAVIGGAATEAERSDVARRLIEWGYTAFAMTRVFEAGQTVGEAELFGGETPAIGLRLADDFDLLLPTTDIGRVQARIVYSGPVPVPVAEGAEIGYLQILLDGQELARRPVLADRSVGVGPLLNRAGDAFANLMNRLVVTDVSSATADKKGRASAKPVEPGRFITLEGGEGGGKTTQILRLAERLNKAGIHVATTREPGGTPKAEAIRRFLLSGAAKSLGAEAEAVLFASARADHVETLIRPTLAKGSWVLCDRFIDSTRAYQGGAGVPLDLITALEQATVGSTRPDLTAILDLPAELGLLRAAQRHAATKQAADRFERDALAEHRRRRQIFLDIAAEEPERCIVVDASRPEGEVAEAIWQAVVERLGVTGKADGSRA